MRKYSMNLEDQVISLDLAGKLKELGVKHESLFFWDWHSDTCHAVKFSPYSCPGLERYSAFTVAELGEILIKSELSQHLELDYYTTSVFNLVVQQNKAINFKSHYVEDASEANARAKMLIYLIENKLIEI